MKPILTRHYIALISIVFTVQISGCSAVAGVKPSQVTCNKFLKQMQGHKYKAAYGLLSTKCKSLTTTQGLQDYWELLEKNKGKVQSWTQQGGHVQSDPRSSYVQLGYTLKCAKVSTGGNFTCVSENNKWLIHGFTFKVK